jgi:acetyltransferase-like isoleucine patch superfamily enzyme
MLTMKLYQWKNWLQHHPNPGYRKLFAVLKKMKNLDIPTPQFYNRSVYLLYTNIRNLSDMLLRVFLHTPSFKGRLKSCGQSLYLYSGLPFVSGPLNIHIGNHCRISGQTTFSGRSASHNPELRIGNNVGIGWQTTIAVGRKVIIGDNVRIAGRSFLFGYPGHPMNAAQRAQGLPDSDSQVGDIHLENDVWLGSNVTVSSGVTIGEGTVVCSGSVVTKSLPPFVLAGGNPAKVIRSIHELQ